MTLDSVRLVTFPDDLVSIFVRSRPPTKDFSNQILVDQAQQWVDECQDVHEMCPRRTIPLLPKRVLDVRQYEDLPVKLHISRPKEKGRYTTLSYC
jgi:hypothetical protein